MLANQWVWKSSDYANTVASAVCSRLKILGILVQQFVLLSFFFFLAVEGLLPFNNLGGSLYQGCFQFLSRAV